MGLLPISDAQKAFILESVAKNAAGSSRVRVGGTDVIVAVKVEIGTPELETPDRGMCEFSVECSPLASPAFRGRGGDDLSAELSSAIEKAYGVGISQKTKDSPIDLASLCILPGKSCWVLYIDALVLDLDGSVVDAIAIGCRAALHDTKIPKVEIQKDGDEEDFEIDDDPEQATRVDVSRVPLSLSVGLVGSSIVLDLTGDEEDASSMVVVVSSNPQGQICGVSKHRGEGVAPTLLMDMVGIAKKELQERHLIVSTFLENHMMTDTT